MSAFSRLSAASRPRQRKVCGSSPACVRTSQPYQRVRRGHSRRARGSHSSSPPCSAPPLSSRSSRSMSVGGLACCRCCGMNSAGTRACASAPRICSRGIQPSPCMRCIQCASTSLAMAGFHTPTSSWWKPSSHRKPRGKKGREGTTESSGAGLVRPAARHAAGLGWGLESRLGWGSGSGSGSGSGCVRAGAAAPISRPSGPATEVVP